MRRYSMFLGSCVVLVGLLAAVVAGAAEAPSAEAERAWGAAPGVEPCGSETVLERLLARDPSLRQKLDTFESQAREAERVGLAHAAPRHGGPTTATAPLYVIPVAVHIVYAGPGDVSDITDSQVRSQIDALNRDFKNQQNNGSPAVNTQIQFCLAQTLPAGSPVVWSTTNGITRTISTETNTICDSLASEMALKAIDYLPSDHYLNIWVVKSISGGNGGVVGYATFPGTVPPTLDGIVMRHDVFGSNLTGWGTFNLLPSNADGRVLPHEVGHYLDLYHTFHNGCGGVGDQVTDTTPEAVNRWGCPVAPVYSCTGVPDPIENFMDYTNDACRFAFTNGQTIRMQTAIATYRSVLASAQNLLDTGCPSGLYASISVNPSAQICSGGSVVFNSAAAGQFITYAWSFPGGVPSSAATQLANVSYPSPGAYTATLTITDTQTGEVSTNFTKIYVNACSPILGPCSRWVFSHKCELDFSTGSPLPVAGTVNAGMEAGATQSDLSGNLIFYSDAETIWNANHVAMPNGTGLLGGHSSHGGALAVPYPGHPKQFLLFTISSQEHGAVTQPVRYCVIDSSLNGGTGDVVAGLKNVGVQLPGNPTQVMEGQTLIRHCNGVDWWHITQGAGSGAGGASGKIFVTPVTSAGPGIATAYPIGSNVPSPSLGGVAASVDGSMFAICSFLFQKLAVYDFDRSTGVPTTHLAPTFMNVLDQPCFSPDGKLLYFNTYTNAGSPDYGVQQLDLATLQQRTVMTSYVGGDMQMGPDGRIYICAANSPRIHCINYPDRFNTLNANECGFNPNSVALGGTASAAGGLPNTVLQCVGSVPAQFMYTVTSCTTVAFHATNCSASYAWTFGDGFTGVGQNAIHTYATPGTYSVTLTVVGAAPPTATQTFTLGAVAVSIAGPAPGCASPSNYSAVGPAGYAYQWSVSGGLPATASGNNVDVVWGAAGGSVILVATDPITGCTSRDTLVVPLCPTCVKPPLYMSAWWPLDEPTGVTATEIVAANDGADINAPGHVVGQVLQARHFDGATNYVRANDDTKLNFGFGDLTIDAWIRTTAEASFVPVVDKRNLAPEQGYALYLKNGRLAFRLADGSGAPGTEFYSTATPYIADGQWHHVAAVTQRALAASGTRLFVDGSLVASLPAYPANRNLTNTQRLLIGAQAPAGAPAGYFAGDIDEVELFRRALVAFEIQGLYAAGALGKCKEYCQAPWGQTLCKFQNFTIVSIIICNYSPVPQSYNLNFAGLPVGMGGCTYAGPNGFQIQVLPPVIVPANSCVPVPVKIFRPAGMPVGASSCYEVTITNMASGLQRSCRGSIFRTNIMCPVAKGPVIHHVQIEHPVGFRFGVTSTADSAIHISYRVNATPSTLDTSEPFAMSLNGMTPGTPFTGLLTLAPGDSADVEVEAQFTEAREFRPYEVVLELDADGDGIAEAQCSEGAVYEADSASGTVSVDSRPIASGAEFTISPNPLGQSARVEFTLSQRARVRMTLYDLSGRHVRTLVDGAREAGINRVAIDAHGLAGGVYFLRLEAAGKETTRRLVLLR